MSIPSTIFALASAQGRAGVAVFRLSGPKAASVFNHLCPHATQPAPREATLREIRHPRTGETLDRALIVWFPAPRSYTGEDVVELHLHGGRAIIHAVAEALGTLPDFRLAEAGEFTRRAFENGKMDLTEAEAVADLINAETEAQRRQALRQQDGALRRLYDGWRERLVRILAYLEAFIDFSEEELPTDMETRQGEPIAALRQDMIAHLNDGRRGERLRNGFSIALLGAPNAGKSSLLNALAQRDAAIVSATAGTTRDVIEVHLDLGGYPVTLMDTAGLRESADQIESEGIRRALQRAEHADFKLLVFDGTLWPVLDKATHALKDGGAFCVVNKSDAMDQPATEKDFFFLSAKTGEGIPVLLEKLGAIIAQRADTSAQPALTRERHRAALTDCVAHLDRALSSKATELRAEDVRLATRALGRITGRVDVEDLLDVIFRDFCIGK